MFGDSLFPASVPVARRLAPWIAIVVIGGASIGYAVHEHNSAQNLAAQNQQVTAQLNATHSELDALSQKLTALTNSIEVKPAPAARSSSSVAAVHNRPSAAHHGSAQDARFKKMQSQLDAQGKAIEDARNDLVSTRTELTGSIARTHDELVVLEKKGQRNYYEFDLQKPKSSPFAFASGCTSQFKREGPLSLCLKKANAKHQYADLQLMVDDRDLSQKHVNLYQPVMFYQPDMSQPIEIVINEISKDHIHGYVSASKYKQSELTAANAGSDSQAVGDQPPDSSTQSPTRQKLPVPAAEPNQQ